MNEVLYNKLEADALTESEKNESWRNDGEILKSNLILEHTKDIESLLDIGCAWGQTLRQLVGKIPNLAGADESADRLESLKNNDHNIQTYKCRSTNLDIDDNSFDAILMSHILHEVKLFGNENDLEDTASEIKRVLKPNGSFIIIDHRDPGEGTVTIKPGKQMENLKKFQNRFEMRDVKVEYNDDSATMSTRDCHDFVTKIWSLDKGAEDLEMNETHTVINQKEFAKELEDLGFDIKTSLDFNPIEDMMKYYGVELVDGNGWGRQVFMVASPSA